jgi:hypothetical protein
VGDANPAQLAPYVAWGAFALAFVFGAVANKTDFCTMGAVSDWVNMGSLNRMRMWLLAIGVAILGANALYLAGAIDLSKSIYPGPNFTVALVHRRRVPVRRRHDARLGCGSKTLIRIGGGNLKSVVVFIVTGIVAYMTLRGISGAFRVGVLEQASVTLAGGQDLPSLLSRLAGGDKKTGSSRSARSPAAVSSRMPTARRISARPSITRWGGWSPDWSWWAGGM